MAIKLKLATALTAVLLVSSHNLMAQCEPSKFMVSDYTNILWTEQLKISFILTATKEQYEQVNKSWGASGGYGLFYGSLNYEDAKNAATKEAESRKYTYDKETYLNYSSQRLSPLAEKMYSECLTADRQSPSLKIWVAKRERNFYTLNAFWVGGEREGVGTYTQPPTVDGLKILQKPVDWPKGETQPIYLKKEGTADGFLSFSVSGKIATIFLLSDLPEPHEAAVTNPSLLRITSGGTSDGNSLFCQRRTVSGCVHPTRPDGYLEPGSGHLTDQTTNGRVGWAVLRDTPVEICVELWAATTGCPTEVSISGRVSATERYPVSAPAAPAASKPKRRQSG